MKNEDMIAEIVAHTKHIQETNGQYAAFEIFQSKWYARVLFELCQKNPSRFGELKKAIPEISNVVLTSALRGSEEKKLQVRSGRFKIFWESFPHQIKALSLFIQGRRERY